MADKDKTRSRWFASLGTVLFAALVVVILHLMGLNYWVPPPPEYGIEVNLGYAETGMGAAPAASEQSDAASASPSTDSPAEENMLTSDEDDAPVLAAQPKRKTPKSKPAAKPKPEPVRESAQPKPETTQEKSAEPTLNPMALYPGKRRQPSSDAQGTGQGIKKGDGDMGSPTGSSQSGDYGRGGAGGGVSFSLTGRTLMSLVKPDYNSDEQGIVVVKIWVNRQGAVVRTQVGVQGTTTMDEQLWATADRAARGSRFVPKDNAPEEQVGTISYKFIIGQ